MLDVCADTVSRWIQNFYDSGLLAKGVYDDTLPTLYCTSFKVEETRHVAEITEEQYLQAKARYSAILMGGGTPEEAIKAYHSITGGNVYALRAESINALKWNPLFDEIAAEIDMPVDKVREIMRVAQEPVSLETPIGEEEDSHLGDFIPDNDAPAPADAASHTMLREQLSDVLSTLTPREAKVLKLRFGLEDGRSRTLEEVGKEFNVTRERIRQIEAKALRKLRHPSRSRKLKDYLDY